MRILKTIFTYMLILVGLALTGALICATLLYFGVVDTIFGYSYVGGFKGEKVITLSVADATAFDKIEVTTENIEIEVLPYGDETADEIKITYAIAADGFTNDEDVREFATTAEIIDGVVQVKIQEPEGLIWHRDSYIVVEVSYYLNTDRKDIEITSNGGKVTVGQKSLEEDPDLIEDRIFKLNNLTLNNGSATMYVKNVSVTGNLKVKNKAFKTYINSDIEGNVEIDSYVGSFDFIDDNNVRTDIAGNLTVKESSVNPAIVLGNLTGRLDYGSPTDIIENGLLDIANLNGEANIYSENVGIDFGTVLSDLVIESESSMIDINTIGVDNDEAGTSHLSNVHSVQLDVQNSRVTIGDLYYNTIINSERGNITIGGLAAFASLDTNQGNITVTFKNNDVAVASKFDYSYETNTSDFVLNAHSTEGDITVNGIDKRVSLVTGSGTVDAEFELVTTDGGSKSSIQTLGNNIVTTTGGDINLVVPAEDIAYDTDTFLDINKASASGVMEVAVIGTDEADGAKWIEVEEGKVYDIWVGDKAAVDGTIVITTNDGAVRVSDNV